jgi:hypothetical protein
LAIKELGFEIARDSAGVRAANEVKSSRLAECVARPQKEVLSHTDSMRRLVS